MKINYILGLTEAGFHKIVYSEWGEAREGNTIICVHGLTRNRHDFDEIGAYLAARDFHSFCPDMVGRGDSDWLKNPHHYTYEQYGADLNTLIARTQAEKLSWIGTSMGGILGMVMASMPNSPIKRLVINDIGAQVSVKGLTNLAKYIGKMPDFHSLEEAIQYYKTTHFGFGNLTDDQWRTFTLNSVKEISPGLFRPKVDMNIHTLPTKSKMAWQLLMHPRKALQGLFFDVDLWRYWHNIHCPVLLIHGQQSDLLSAEVVAKMQQTNAQLEVIEVPTAGHAPALLDINLLESIYKWLVKTENS